MTLKSRIRGFFKSVRSAEIIPQAQIASAPEQTQSNVDGHTNSGVAKRNRMFSIATRNEVSLGKAWASNTVNATIFRHHGILTIGDAQYTAFYASEKCIRIIKRRAGYELESYDLLGSYTLRDAHNSISFGYDKNLCLHITYDHHGTRLRYRRATKPESIDDWTAELGMTGQHEDKVTYPTFINPSHGHPMCILYRDGIWNKGCARIKTYDEATQSWADRETPILSGQDEHPWTSNAYWNHPVVGADGTLHLSYVWRTDSIGPEQRINNMNICYARSADNGLNWETSLGQPYKLPITPVNTETVHAVSPGNNLMNQCSMALDSAGDPHIVFYANDANGIPQYFHLWQKDRAWRVVQVGTRETGFNLEGAGTLQLPISRPDIVLDKEDNAYVIYRGDLTGNKMVIQASAEPEYQSFPENELIILDVDLGSAEPVIDRTNWSENGILTLYLQYAEQQNGDIKTDPKYSDAVLVDVAVTHSDFINSSSSK